MFLVIFSVFDAVRRLVNAEIQFAFKSYHLAKSNLAKLKKKPLINLIKKYIEVPNVILECFSTVVINKSKTVFNMKHISHKLMVST